MSGAPFSELHYKFCLLYAAAQLEREKAEAEAAKGAYRRNATDDDLVDVAVQGLQSKRWPNKHQAALALTPPDAKGERNPSMVRRLEIKISKVLETTRNTSKD